MFERIAVALDKSEPSQRALCTSIDLTKRLGSQLITVTVREPLPAYTAFATAADSSALRSLEEDHTRFYETMMSSAVAKGESEGLETEAILLEGDQVDSITRFVEDRGINLLVIGLHKRSLRIYSLWSSVCALAQELSCSMLGVH